MTCDFFGEKQHHIPKTEKINDIFQVSEMKHHIN